MMHEEKSKNWTKEDKSSMMADFSKFFEEFGTMKDKDPASAEVQTQVKRVQDFITENMYTCTPVYILPLVDSIAAATPPA